MSKFKVYVSDFDYPDLSIEKSILEPIGAEVIGLSCNSGENLGELAADADAILQQYARITRNVIDQLKNCKVIARYGIGVDIVDVAAAQEHGILVTNVPDYCLDEVADHAISDAFMLMRNLPFYNQKIHEGSYQWQDWRAPLPRFRGARFGLLGFGRIAQNLAGKLHAFGFDIVSSDPYVSEGCMRSHGVVKVTAAELFATSNVVCVLCPYTAETHHIVNAEMLKLMNNESYLVGVSRGKCIDNKALYTALKEGWIVAAALDDPEEEPMKSKNWSPDNNPLFSLDNCFFTPHTAYCSKQSLEECRHVASNNVKAVLLGQKPADIVRPRSI
ncbi:MAG: C-terminal binding protein [Eubacteriales bacterium]